MGRAPKPVVAVVLLPLVLYGAFKVYVYYSVKGRLDDLIAQVRPFVGVRYGGIGSSLGGVITVDAVELRPMGRPGTVHIDGVALEGSGPGFLLHVARGLGSGRMPQRLRLTLTGVLSPDLSDMLAAGLVAADRRAPAPCSLAALLGAAAPLRADSAAGPIDVWLGYRLEPAAGRASFEMGYRTSGHEHMTVTAVVAGLPDPVLIAEGTVPRLDTIHLAYAPTRDYVIGRVKHCADHQRAAPAALLDALLGRPPAQLAADLGVLPGPGLRRALRTWLLDPGEVRASTGPIDEPMQGLRNATPAQLIARIGLRLTVDGAEVSDLSYTEPPGVAAPAGPAAGGGRAGSPGGGNARPVEHPHFVEVVTEELPQHLQQVVRIQATGQERPREGILVGVGNGDASVQQRVAGGKLTAHIPLSTIRKAEVLIYH
jgi:hypothetical protein